MELKKLLNLGKFKGKREHFRGFAYATIHRGTHTDDVFSHSQNEQMSFPF